MDKANVLEVSQLWRDTVSTLGGEYRTYAWSTCTWTMRQCG